MKVKDSDKSTNLEEFDDKIRNIRAQVTKIENETLKKLRAKGVDDELIDFNKDLISQYAYQRAQLKDLADYLAKNGVKEFYLNGSNQFGYKDRVEAKIYNNLFKNFVLCKKTLNDLLFNGANTDPSDDGFDEDELE